MGDALTRSARRLAVLCVASPLAATLAGLVLWAAGLIGAMPAVVLAVAGIVIAAILGALATAHARAAATPGTADGATASSEDEHLRTLAQFVPGVLYSYDLYPNQPRRCNYLSTGFEDLLGPKAAAEIGRRFDLLFEHIHPDDWPRIRQQATEAAKTSAPINSETRIRTDDGSYRWVRSFGRPMKLPNEGTRWHVVLVDIQEQKDLEEQHLRIEEQLRESERQLRLITDSLPVLIGFVDQTETYRFVNAAYQEWWGRTGEEILGRTVTDVLGTEIYEKARPHIRRALAGQTVSYENSLTDALGHVRDVHIMYVPRVSVAGEVIGYYSVATDITTVRQDEKRRRLLMRELDHRVKNNLAAVLSLTRQTLERSSTLEEFATALLGRIHAMSKTHEMLAEAQWRGLELERGARLVLGPYLDVGQPRVQMAGPPVVLPASLALPVCLALHELATNAAKYGALSVTDGDVNVEWTTENRHLDLLWQEQNGPPILDSQPHGTGMELLRGFIEFELRGSVHANFRPEGLECRMTIPLQTATDDDQPVSEEGRIAPVQAQA